MIIAIHGGLLQLGQTGMEGQPAPAKSRVANELVVAGDRQEVLRQMCALVEGTCMREQMK